MDEYFKNRIQESMEESSEITAKKQVSFFLLDQYLKQYGENASEEDRSLVPMDFVLCKDWDKKNQILKEALDGQKKIQDCSLFLTILEGESILEEEEKTH